jgi:hypothetical protein
LSSRSPNELWFFFVGKLKQLAIAFIEQRPQIMMLEMMVWPANNIKHLPTISRTSNQQYQKSTNNIKNQQQTMSKTSHQINGSLPINSSES